MSLRESVYPRAMRLLYLCWLNLPPLRPVTDRLMAAVFDSVADRWDQFNNDPARLDPLYAAVDRLDGDPRRILDMGCGNGTSAIWLADRFPGAWVFGIDISPRMIDEAAGKTSAAGSAARFSARPNQATGFADGEFDLVTLVNAPPPFGEIDRILAPGGHAVIVFTQGPNTWFYSRPERLEKGFGGHGLHKLVHESLGNGEFFVAAKR